MSDVYKQIMGYNFILVKSLYFSRWTDACSALHFQRVGSMRDHGPDFYKEQGIKDQEAWKDNCPSNATSPADCLNNSKN